MGISIEEDSMGIWISKFNEDVNIFLFLSQLSSIMKMEVTV